MMGTLKTAAKIHVMKQKPKVGQSDPKSVSASKPIDIVGEVAEKVVTSGAKQVTSGGKQHLWITVNYE